MRLENSEEPSRSSLALQLREAWSKSESGVGMAGRELALWMYTALPGPQSLTAVHVFSRHQAELLHKPLQEWRHLCKREQILPLRLHPGLQGQAL